MTAVTEPTELVQLLTPEGERVEHPDIDLSPLTDEEYRDLYRDLVMVRRTDVEATALQRQGELGLWASLLGQEAAQVGAGRAMAPQDYAFPTYREHGVAWCRGVDPLTLLGLFRGVSHGGWDPSEHSFALYTIVIGSQTLHATGYAMGLSNQGKVGSREDGGAAVMAFFGDGASSQGDVNEAFVWSAVFNAPVVFFCQNNQWAISEPLEKQTRIPLYQRARGFGFPGLRVDGNDVLATLAVTRAALDRARQGGGPTLVEAFTYRMGAHTTSDDPTRYRLASDLEAWKLKDPLERVKSFLYKQQMADGAFFAGVEAEADELAARLRAGCLSMPEPDLGLDVRPRLRRRDAAARDRAGGDGRLPRRVRRAGRATDGRVEPGRPGPAGALTMAKAINEGLRRVLESDPNVLIMGEDVGKLGGVFRVTDGLQKDFGEDRVIDTPLAESGIVGTAIGLALSGFRPVCEIQFDGFVFPAFDQIVSQLAKLHYRSSGTVRMPVTIRIPFGGGIGAVEHHSESPEAYFAHTAGLKVVACSNPERRLLDVQQHDGAADGRGADSRIHGGDRRREFDGLWR